MMKSFLLLLSVFATWMLNVDAKASPVWKEGLKRQLKKTLEQAQEASNNNSNNKNIRGRGLQEQISEKCATSDWGEISGEGCVYCEICEDDVCGFPYWYSWEAEGLFRL